MDTVGELSEAARQSVDSSSTTGEPLPSMSAIGDRPSAEEAGLERQDILHVESSYRHESVNAPMQVDADDRRSRSRTPRRSSRSRSPRATAQRRSRSRSPRHHHSRRRRRRSYSRSASRSRSQSRKRDFKNRDRSRDRSRSVSRGRRRIRRDEPAPSHVLGVFNLSLKTREEDLQEIFGEYGKVSKVVIVYDHRTERSRGFGFVYMDSIEGATMAKEKTNGMVLNARAMRVDYSLTQRAHTPTPGEYMGDKRRKRYRGYRRSPSPPRYRRYYSRSRSRSWSPRPRKRSRSGSYSRRGSYGRSQRSQSH